MEAIHRAPLILYMRIGHTNLVGLQIQGALPNYLPRRALDDFFALQGICIVQAVRC